MGSTRLPGKVLLKIDGMTLLERAWRTSCAAFGRDNVVIAMPDTPENQPICSHGSAMLAQMFAWNGPEDNVLGRFYNCAHHYRWHPDSVIVRVTPDDWRKDAKSMVRVAAGERLPVEMGGEAFTLAMLDKAADIFIKCEHITHAIFPTFPPLPPSDGLPWSIDTQEDYVAAVARPGQSSPWQAERCVA